MMLQDTRVRAGVPGGTAADAGCVHYLPRGRVRPEVGNGLLCTSQGARAVGVARGADGCRGDVAIGLQAGSDAPTTW